MLIAIVILSVLLFFALMFALAFLVHAKYTTEALKIMTEYANSLKKMTDSLFANQKSLIDNHIELLNRFNNLAQWTINQGLRAKEEPLEDADDIICLADKDYVEDSDGCLLVDPNNFNTFFDAEIVDIHTVENLDHYKRYRFRADKGPKGELIFEPTGFEYDDEQSQDVSSHEVPCRCDCTECEYAYKCFENGRYDFSDCEGEEEEEDEEENVQQTYAAEE